MTIKGVSHIAIGVSDMERSLKFYRDVLGLRVTLDNPRETPVGKRAITRHGVYLRWRDGPDEPFIVLARNDPVSGNAIRLDQVGIHHFSLWVDDLEEVVERAAAADTPVVLLSPVVLDSSDYGEPSGGRVKTVLLRDPDGIVVQLDQRMETRPGD